MNLVKNLPKNLKYGLLAQCDGQIVRQLVEYGERAAETVVPLMSSEQYEKFLQNSEDARKVHKVLDQAYKDLGAEFKIVHDLYGGYCLKYVGDKVIQKGFVFRDAPMGLLARVGPNQTKLSVVTKTSGGGEFLMLGTIRFVNSDCEPNCEYDLSSSDNIVKLRVKRKIKKNDELTVNYGQQFFGRFVCQCPTCETKKKILAACEIVATDFLEAILGEFYTALAKETIDSAKKRRFEKMKRSPTRLGKRPKFDALAEFSRQTRLQLNSGSDETASENECTILFVDEFESTYVFQSGSDETASSMSDNSDLTGVSSQIWETGFSPECSELTNSENNDSLHLTELVSTITPQILYESIPDALSEPCFSFTPLYHGSTVSESKHRSSPSGLLLEIFFGRCEF